MPTMTVDLDNVIQDKLSNKLVETAQAGSGQAVESTQGIFQSRTRGHGHAVAELYNAAGQKVDSIDIIGVGGGTTRNATLILKPDIDGNEGLESEVSSESAETLTWKVGPTNYGAGSKVVMKISGSASSTNESFLTQYFGASNYIKAFQGNGITIVEIPFSVSA